MRWVCYGYFVDLQLPTTVRSSYSSKLCDSMSVLAVEWYLMYLIILAMQDMRRVVTWASYSVSKFRTRTLGPVPGKRQIPSLHSLASTVHI